jgi:hypothetical protein
MGTDHRITGAPLIWPAFCLQP